MNAHTIYFIALAVVLVLAVFAFWRRWGIQALPAHRICNCGCGRLGGSAWRHVVFG